MANERPSATSVKDEVPGQGCWLGAVDPRVRRQLPLQQALCTPWRGLRRTRFGNRRDRERGAHSQRVWQWNASAAGLVEEDSMLACYLQGQLLRRLLYNPAG